MGNTHENPFGVAFQRHSRRTGIGTRESAHGERRTGMLNNLRTGMLNNRRTVIGCLRLSLCVLVCPRLSLCVFVCPCLSVFVAVCLLVSLVVSVLCGAGLLFHLTKSFFELQRVLIPRGVDYSCVLSVLGARWCMAPCSEQFCWFHVHIEVFVTFLELLSFWVPICF